MSRESLQKTQQFLQTISNKKHKIVKYLETNHTIKAQKIMTFAPSEYYLFELVQHQLNNIQNYLKRKLQKNSILQLNSKIQLVEEGAKVLNVIKVITTFSEHPNLYDYYQLPHYRQTHHHLQGTKGTLHYFEEFFQLIVRASGIQNYFYTPQNIFITIPDKNKGIDLARISLNLFSLAGLKFLFRTGTIQKSQFFQILPLLPPNTYTLLQTDRKELDVIIKIRSFAFNMLCFVLKKIPEILTDKNIETLIDPEKENIQSLVKRSPESFKQILDKQSETIKKSQNETKIGLLYFFTRVFINNNMTSWSEVHQIVFLRNIYNIGSYDRSLSTSADDLFYFQSKQYFQKMIRMIWLNQSEDEKESYRQKGLVDKQAGMVYFMVKINCNFHRMLRYINVMELLRRQKFGKDVSQFTTKLTSYFQKEQIVYRQKNDQELNPFQLIAYPKKECPYYLQKPSSFLDNVLTISNAQKVIDKDYNIITHNYRLQILSKYEHSMWSA